MTQSIELSSIGALVKISQGGQGVVYRAPNANAVFSKSMVFKEYHGGRGGKPNALASINVAALKGMPEFLESLPYRDGAKLISIAAWPCRLVEDNGQLKGFLMPGIPDEFFVDFWTAKGPSRVAAEFQHLLNDPQVLAMRFAGRVITDRQRYELLRQVASALNFLHERGVCVGDISPKNLLFSLSGAPAVYFIDCDAMRVKGVSLAHQLETPGWEVPRGEEKATVYSDRYKLGLLALRLILGNQDAKDPARLPPSVPDMLRQVVTNTLTQSGGKRPPLSTWDLALDKARLAAPVQRAKGPMPVAPSPIRPRPSHPAPVQRAKGPMPVTPSPIRPRPSHPAPVQRAKGPTPVTPSPIRPRPSHPAPVSQRPAPPPPLPPQVGVPGGGSGGGGAPTSSSSKAAWLLVPALLGLFVVFIKMVSGAPESDSSTSTPPTSRPPTSTRTIPTSAAPRDNETTTPATPPQKALGPPPGIQPDTDQWGYSCIEPGSPYRVGRGTEGTSCQFARNVLQTYTARAGSFSGQTLDIAVASPRATCPHVRANANPAPPTVIQCLGDAFIMNCTPAENATNSWVACRGGDLAEVYLW